MEALWILLVPLCWLIVAKVWLRTTFNWKEFAIVFIGVAVITTATIELSKWGATQDTEVHNGEVASKKRVEGYYQTSTTSCDGEGKNCTTTYYDHYTVDWTVTTTVGKVTLKSIESSWRSIYNTPDPARYTATKIGEPASIEHGYTNYVQAVPQSLFNDTSNEASLFEGKIPAYPKVYDFYRINRVINVGSTVPAELQKLINAQLNTALKTLGKQKQVNIILVLTDIQDPSYRYAVENAWQGAEKNDVVIMLGIKDENYIAWADVMTWALNAGNELFHVTLRDELMKVGNVNRPEFVPAITKTIASTYDRPQMSDYEYLADEIEVPTWAMILAAVLAFGLSAFGTWYFHRNEI